MAGRKRQGHCKGNRAGGLKNKARSRDTIPKIGLLSEITVFLKSSQKWILVQNDAKLMPNVVQDGREIPRVAGLSA